MQALLQANYQVGQEESVVEELDFEEDFLVGEYIVVEALKVVLFVAGFDLDKAVVEDMIAEEDIVKGFVEEDIVEEDIVEEFVEEDIVEEDIVEEFVEEDIVEEFVEEDIVDKEEIVAGVDIVVEIDFLVLQFLPWWGAYQD